MTCAAQAAELLSTRVSSGDSVLDAGCGSGYFFHSLRERDIPVEYFGIDSAPTLIEIGQQELKEYGLPETRLKCLRLEDLLAEVDHVVCMNVLSNIDNFHRPLERLLQSARQTVILRESISDEASYHYVVDKYLESDRDLRVHVNTYSRSELIPFIESYGFSVTEITDRRTGGQAEMVIDYPHYWTFVVAERTQRD